MQCITKGIRINDFNTEHLVDETSQKDMATATQLKGLLVTACGNDLDKAKAMTQARLASMVLDSSIGGSDVVTREKEIQNLSTVLNLIDKDVEREREMYSEVTSVQLRAIDDLSM